MLIPNREVNPRQCLSSIAFTMAIEKGFTVDDSFRTEMRDRIENVLSSRHDHMIDQTESAGANITLGYALWGLGGSHTSPSKLTALAVNYLLVLQNREGSWSGGNARPPIEYYSFTGTALAIYTIQQYATPGLKD